MNSYKFRLWFKLSQRNLSCTSRLVEKLVTIFCLVFIVGTASADLSTTPPDVLKKVITPPDVPQKVNQEQSKKQIQIKKIISKARRAIRKNNLTTPAADNALLYVKQLFALSPRDKRALKILNDISNKYISLAYKRLKQYKLRLAQSHHDKALKIARQVNVDFNAQKLAKLQEEITLSRQQIRQLRSAQKKHIKAIIPRINDKAEKQNFTSKKTPLHADELITKQQTAQQLVPEKIKNTVASTLKNLLSVYERNRIVVIVNKKNKAHTLTLDELKEVYKGNKKNWSNGETITLYLPPAHSDELLWLTQNVFQEKSPSAVTRYYKESLAKKQFTQIPVTSTDGVLDVSRTSGSIAIVKATKAEDHHKTIKIFPIKGVNLLL